MKLSDLFVGWYEYSDDEYKTILQNALISFDTNVLLNMYRYSKKASNETFDALKTVKNRILISYYVAKEFTNNRKKVRVDNIREYETLSKLIEDKISDINIELDKYGEKKLSKVSEIKDVLEKSRDRAIRYIANEKQTKSDFYKNHEIENNISEIFFNNLAPEYIEDEFKLIKEEGLRRFADKIPPGYMDDEKEENGDYYIFKSLMDYCKLNKKDLIMAFIDSLDQNSNVYEDFEAFMNSKKKEELDNIINEENLNKEETYKFIQKSFEQGRVETNGTEVPNILPPMNMFTTRNDRQEKKNKVIDKLLEFFDKFFSISSNKM